MATFAFIITIDTEGDKIWRKHGYITTENTRFCHFSRHYAKSITYSRWYLTNYEITIDEAFVDFARDAIVSGNAEIGMHLHAWNSLSAHDLTGR